MLRKKPGPAADTERSSTPLPGARATGQADFVARQELPGVWIFARNRRLLLAVLRRLFCIGCRLLSGHSRCSTGFAARSVSSMRRRYKHGLRAAERASKSTQ